ncbi:MAG: universal stress protein [Candidatus Tectomicrobia bacterium]|nr:universal stress protein [Candidatus Tectomicrobia bacterium]
MHFELSKVLVPVSFSPGSKRALEVGSALAESCGADLLVLHVIHDPFGTEGLHLPFVYVKQQEWERHRKKVTEELHELIREKEELGLSVKELVAEGEPTQKILEVIQEEGVDLLVLHHHPAGWLDRLLTGHDPRRLVERAPCHVLMVHAPQVAGEESG